MSEKEIKCMVCGNPQDKKNGSIVYCAKCATPHHEECWKFNEKCSIYACECPTYGYLESQIPKILEEEKRIVFRRTMTTFGVITGSAAAYYAVRLAIFALIWLQGCAIAVWNNLPSPPVRLPPELVYSPALNAMVCTQLDVENCIRCDNACIIDYSGTTHISVVEYKYLHPVCLFENITLDPNNPCKHLKWIFNVPKTVTWKADFGPKICGNAFYDCFRENRPCITKFVGPTGGLVKFVENKAHPQCTVCGNYLAENKCSGHIPATRMSGGTMNAFALMRAETKWWNSADLQELKNSVK